MKALETVLTEKGLVDPAALDAIVDVYETRVGPRNGARVVAEAWTDPAFRKRLLEDVQRRWRNWPRRSRGRASDRGGER